MHHAPSTSTPSVNLAWSQAFKPTRTTVNRAPNRSWLTLSVQDIWKKTSWWACGNPLPEKRSTCVRPAACSFLVAASAAGYPATLHNAQHQNHYWCTVYSLPVEQSVRGTEFKVEHSLGPKMASPYTRWVCRLFYTTFEDLLGDRKLLSHYARRLKALIRLLETARSKGEVVYHFDKKYFHESKTRVLFQAPVLEEWDATPNDMYMKALQYETNHSLTVSSETPNKKTLKVPSDRILIIWKGKTAFWQNKADNRKHDGAEKLSHKKLYTSPQAKILCWLAKSAEVFSNGDGPTLSNCATTLVTTGLPITEVPKLLWVFSMRLVVGCVAL